jgi:hypothetical protein
MRNVRRNPPNAERVSVVGAFNRWDGDAQDSEWLAQRERHDPLGAMFFIGPTE